MGGRQEGMPALAAVNGGSASGQPPKQQQHQPGVTTAFDSQTSAEPPQAADALSTEAVAGSAAAATVAPAASCTNNSAGLTGASAGATVAKGRPTRPTSSPTPGPCSLDLCGSGISNTTQNCRSVAFKNNVVVVGGGGGPVVASGSSPSSNRCCSSALMNKCRSLPRLTSSAQSSPMTAAVPLAFPRIHVASAMLSSSDLMLDTDQLSMAGNVGLLRSMSARTVDSLVHMDRSLASSNSGSRFLSPSGDVTTDNLAARSTSCPSMAYPMLTCRSGSHFQLRPSPGDETDVNLDGEEITDLPIEPTQNFPDLIPELQEDYTPDSHNGNLPLFTGICDEQEGAPTTPSQPSLEAPEQRHNNNDKKAHAQNATGSAPEGAKDSKQRSEGSYNVSAREKCIRWLKSLSIDKS